MSFRTCKRRVVVRAGEKTYVSEKQTISKVYKISPRTTTQAHASSSK
jgi:hypothetical protein